MAKFSREKIILAALFVFGWFVAFLSIHLRQYAVIWDSQANPIQDVRAEPLDPNKDMLTGALMRSWENRLLLIDIEGVQHDVSGYNLFLPPENPNEPYSLFSIKKWRMNLPIWLCLTILGLLPLMWLWIVRLRVKTSINREKRPTVETG